MKKLTLTIAAVMTLAFSFTSCKKYEVSEPLELSTLPTITIKGDMYAQLDKTNSNLENAPMGLTVTVSIPFSDYDPNNTSNGNYKASTKTDANGKFSIKVPVVTGGVKATVSFESFTSSVIEEAGISGTSEKTTLFKLASKTISGLGAGNSDEFIDLGSLEYYASSTDPNAGSFTPTTSITYEGTLTYEVKSKAGVNIPDTSIYAPIPDGTEILVKIVSRNEFGNQEYKETKTITTTANGHYKIEVPLVKKGSASIKMTSKEILQFENFKLDKRYLYIYNLNVSDNLYFVNYTKKDHKYSRDTYVQDVD